MYIKCGNSVGMYVDPKTRLAIGRGQIVEVKKTTKDIDARIRAKGLIVVSEEEYREWVKKNPTTVLAVSQTPIEKLEIPKPLTVNVFKKEEPSTSSEEKIQEAPIPPNEKKRRFKKL